VRGKFSDAACLEIVDFTDALAPAFRAINAEWIEAMFTLEANDRAILDHPRASIIDRGGIIRFVRAGELGIVGTCALIRIADGVFELTKMGVLASARGRKAGEFLLAHIVDAAQAMRLDRLYLLTSHKCAAAIHLYEKAGFVHDAAVMADFGARYARCDVAMSLPLTGRRTTSPAQASK
jgi:N-acetylglutamate synthase-like GNAT family acetyltransferase